MNMMQKLLKKRIVAEKSSSDIVKIGVGDTWAKVKHIIIAAAMIPLLASCANSTLSAAFIPTPADAQKPPLADTILVCQTTEGRPLHGKSKIGNGFLVFIPLFPFGSQQFTPERYFINLHGVNYLFLEDVSTTVCKDMQASGLARNTVIESKSIPTFPLQPNSYALELRLDEGIWQRNFTCYGLSIGGPLLWMIGLPVSYGSVRFDLKATLYNAQGKKLASKLWCEKINLTEWAYSPPSKLTNRLVILYHRISPELRQFMAENIVKDQEKGAVSQFRP